MTSSVSFSEDMRDPSVLSAANGGEHTTARVRDDSLDGKGGGLRADCQRLMEGHAQRASVLEQYRLMVERRKNTCKKPDEEKPQRQQDCSLPSSASPRACGVFSERRSANEGAAPPSRASGVSGVRTTTAASAVSPANGNANGKNNTSTAAASASRHVNDSYKWTRPRNALAGNTASSAAKRRSKIKSAPDTPRRLEQLSPSQLRNGCGFTDGGGSRCSVQRLSSHESLRVSQPKRHLRSQKHTGAGFSISSSLRQQSQSDLYSISEIALDNSFLLPTEGEQHDVCGGAKDKEKEERCRTDASGQSVSRRSSVRQTEPRDVAAPAPPRGHETSTLEIETEEDKRLLECQVVRAVLSSAPESAVGSTCVSTAREKTSSLEKREEEKEHPLSLNLAGALATAKGAELSLVTSATAHTLDMTSPMLERFGRRAVEMAPKSRRDTHPFPVSSECREPAIFEDFSPDVQKHVCTESEKNSRGSNTTKRAPRLLPHKTHSHAKGHARPASNVSAGHLDGFVANDKAACVATVAAVLQGVLVQARRVLPCYYCGDPQHLFTYRLHLDLCQARTEALYTHYGLNPLRLAMSVPKQSVPGSMASEADMDAFVHACYQSMKESILSCPNCGASIRIHDFPGHEDTCGETKTDSNKNRGSTLRASRLKGAR